MRHLKLTQPLPLPLRHRSHIIFSSNTSIGKTLISAGLIRSALLEQEDNTFKTRIRYAKPLQAGGGHDEDFIIDAIQPIQAVIGDRVKVETKTMFDWELAQSPHLCCRVEEKPVEEGDVLRKVEEFLRDVDYGCRGSTLVETAGGVLSPGPSSPRHNKPYHAANSKTSWGWSTQGDMYSKLGLPVILVGDGKLGGISATLSSLESLILRGYDIDMIVMVKEDENPYNDNAGALKEYLSQRDFKLRNGAGRPMLMQEEDIVTVPPLPPIHENLLSWYTHDDVLESFHNIHVHLNQKWEKSVLEKFEYLEQGKEVVWWPFTEHQTEEKGAEMVDRASGDYYHVLSRIDDEKFQKQDLYDSAASWWTQGLGHGDSSASLAMSAAAGRYGHILFPSILHEPAIHLSNYLVGPHGPGHSWAQRAFFSDDGSTAVEVGIKMAMKLFESRFPDYTYENLTVLAQKDCPWYQSKGLFVDTPTVGYVMGKLSVQISSEELEAGGMSRDTYKALNRKNKHREVSDILDVQKRLEMDVELYDFYRKRVRDQWEEYEQGGHTIACTFLEPILLGAGGMKFIDPLYQRAMLDESKSRNISIVYDEAFAGLYRLGPNVTSCRTILGVDPDIASYAKLLTGGTVPMGITLASQEVFQAYLGDVENQAFLHGHAFTAYPIGCSSAIHALESFRDYFQRQPSSNDSSYFNEEDVWCLSTLPHVQESFALGTVLVVKLKPHEEEGGDGNTLSRSKDVVRLLRQHGIYARPLGNVVYTMVSPMTEKDDCEKLCDILATCIQEAVHEE